MSEFLKRQFFDFWWLDAMPDMVNLALGPLKGSLPFRKPDDLPPVVLGGGPTDWRI